MVIAVQSVTGIVRMKMDIPSHFVLMARVCQAQTFLAVGVCRDVVSGTTRMMGVGMPTAALSNLDSKSRGRKPMHAFLVSPQICRIANLIWLLEASVLSRPSGR